MEQEIRAFFEAYARRFNESLRTGGKVDVEGVRAAVARYFVESSPAGVHGGRNGILFAWMVPRGFAHYRRIGTTLMRIDAIDVTAIDDMHAMAKVTWHSEYRKKSGDQVSIDFPVVYLLRIDAGAPEIFASIAGDEQKALREHGLMD
jgi:hypothetical protein